MTKKSHTEDENLSIDLAHSHSGGRLVGGRLSEIANYSDLFIRTRDAIFLTDLKEFKILECNPSVQQILGVSPDKIQNDSFLNWVRPSSQETVKKHLVSGSRSKRAEPPFDCEMGNGVIFELSVCGLKLGDYGEVLQIIAKDVTQMRLVQHELEQTNKRLETISVTDEMTQVSNFRHFMTELEKEHARSERYKSEYSIIFCDVDHFKNYNDTNGHPAGDEALKTVASILKNRVRKLDLCARYGGEEFVVLCPNTGKDAAYALAENLREMVANHAFKHGEKQPLGKVTASMGVATYPEHGKTFKEVLQSADACVYKSKREGRNRVTPADHIDRSISIETTKAKRAS
jgi:diguanylate cyclase (GGDEF)-like protein/PAS domain S-box-containing protein